MLLHTIIDLNDIFYEQEKPSALCCKDIGTLHIEGERFEQGIRVKRIISTDPNHYLDSKYSPNSYMQDVDNPKN